MFDFDKSAVVEDAVGSRTESSELEFEIGPCQGDEERDDAIGLRWE
jgi:hypothetical protein